MFKTWVSASIVGLLIGSLQGCGSYKEPFAMVQMCLRDEAGLKLFVSEIRSIAEQAGVDMIDSSAATKKDLQKLGELGPGSVAINLGLQTRDGTWLTASNLGMPGYQAVVGFAEGADTLKSRKFAEEAIARLERHWTLASVPAGQGAFPLSGC